MEIKADLLQDSIGQLCPIPIAHLAMNIRKMEIGQILKFVQMTMALMQTYLHGAVKRTMSFLAK